MLMVGSFDDKVKVWVIFHNSAFLLKYVLEVVEKLQFILMDDAKMSNCLYIGFIGGWGRTLSYRHTTQKKFQKMTKMLWW